MKYDNDLRQLIFESTGRKKDAYFSVIGIGDTEDIEDDTRLSVYYGSDGALDLDDLTDIEYVEISDYMISRWQDFKNKKVG